MGILNVTPDSFSDGGKYSSVDKAVKAALRMVDQGADIIDIGGESTRPGALQISVDEEISRTLPVVEGLASSMAHRRTEPIVQISIDTRKPEVAKAAIDEGAHIWNDVSALTFDAHSVDVAAGLNCPVILMHMQGTPGDMQDAPTYDDVVAEIKLWLTTRITAAVAGGVRRENIIIDPGVGFGKTVEHNLALLKYLKDFTDIYCPILIGASRKSFIKGLDSGAVKNRLGGSVAIALWAADQGAAILRVHDVVETVQALKVWDSIQGG